MIHFLHQVKIDIRTKSPPGHIYILKNIYGKGEERGVYKYVDEYGSSHQGTVHPHEKYLSNRCRSEISQLEYPIYFYEHVGEEGIELEIGAGLNYPDVGTFDNRISSILMSPRTEITVFIDKNYTGRGKTYENDTDLWRYIDLVEDDFNDVISSVKTKRI
jgi:hypothetical protein